MKVLFIRHGKTKGNIKKQYIGRTDEPLVTEGIESLINDTKPQIDKIIADELDGKTNKISLVASPMIRCLETAKILFEDNEEIYSTLSTNEKLMECNFGEFECKSYIELNGNEDYQRFINSGGKTAFPGGESRAQFKKRCVEGFKEEVHSHKDSDIIIMVVHGGTIMSIMNYFYENKDYYDFQIKNGAWIMHEFDINSI